MKKTILALMLFVLSFSFIMAESINFSDSNYGADEDPVVSTITTTGIPEGSEITDIQITTSFGTESYIGNWYDIHLNINGTDYPSVGWLSAQSYSDLNTLGPNGLTVTATTEDLDNYGDSSTLVLSVDVFYNPPAGTPDAPLLVSPENGAINVAINANLEWTTDEITDYAVLYLADNAEFTDALIVNPATSPYTSSLNNGTSYFWKVVAVGPTAIEMSSDVSSFTTEFGAITEFPYNEGFEDTWIGSPAAPAGWGQISVSGSNVWLRYTTSPQSGLACARGPWASAGGEQLLITPIFDLDASTSYRLKFWLKGSTSAGTDLQLQIADAYTGASDFSTEIASYVAGTNMPSAWTEQIISLEGYSGNQAIAFRMIDDDGYSVYIDNVTVEEIPATPIVEINTDPIAFGTVSLNEASDSEIVSIQNIGGGTLNITDISITGTDADQFSYTDSEDYALAATEDLLIEVTFNPTSAGEKSATLQITDDLTREVYEIALSGNGIDTNIYEINIPYTQDFETEEGFLGWTSNLTSTSSSATAGRYSSSYSAHAGTYSYRVYNYNDTSATAELISPVVVPDMDAYRLRFWAKRSGTPTLILGKYNQTMDNFTAIDTLDLTTTYAEYSIDMVSPVRANERIAFKSSFSSTYQYVYIDDLTLEEIPQGTLVQVSPDSHDFGEVFLATEASQTFTVSNNGSIAATITEFETPAGYSYDTAIVTPYTLEVGSSFDVEVTFTPQAEMIYAGNLVVKESDPSNPFVPINHEVALTGTGIPIPQGSTCANPLLLTFPAEEITGNTADYSDDYSSTWITPTSSYMNGDDVVYQFTLANTMLLNGTITTTGSWMGAFILENEPNVDTPAEVLLTKSSSGNTLTYTNEMIPAGTYFLIISSYPSPQSVDYTINLTADALPLPEAATNPSPANQAIDQATALTLEWTNADYTETIDLYFGTTGAREMALVLDDVAAVEEYAVTNLDPSTEYAWKVINRNYTGETTDTLVATWTFTTVGQAPDAVTYTAPANEASDIALNGNLTWQTATGATGYYVYFSTDQTFAGMTPVDQTATSYAYSGLDYETTYYWKVVPYNVVGQATEGIEVWSFTTVPDPTMPMPIMVDFEGSTSIPQAITDHNFIIGTDQHNTVGNVMYKNIYSTASNGYIQFQSMNNINALAEITLDYRLTNWSAGTVGITSVDGHDYLTITASTDNGATFNPIASVNGTDHTDTADFTTFTTDISAFAGQSVIFRFEMLDDSVNDYWFDIDNIYFGEPASTPVASLNASEIDFGIVNVGQTASDNVTISNIGVGTLNISTIEIVGDNADDFAYSTDPEASMALGEDQSLVITLDFTPSAEGSRVATLQITDDLNRTFRVNTAAKNTSNNRGVNEVALSGEGFVLPQGDDHNDPITLTLAETIVENNTTTPYNESYDFCTSQSVVYKLTLPTDKLMSISLDGTSWDTKLWVFNSYQQIDEATVNSDAWYYNDDQSSASTGGNRAKSRDRATWSEMLETVSPAGEYYIVVSGYSSNNGDFTLTINTAETALPDPEVPVNFAIANDGAAITLSWEAAANATSYNVYACDTPDGEYVFVENVEGLTTTITASDSMKFFRVKGSNSGAPELAAKGFRRQ